jgi:Skp family chaperone for outer membrane proteins
MGGSLPGRVGSSGHENEEYGIVKRSMLWVLGTLSLAAAVYFGNKLWAQPPARPAASAQTRVAMLNLRWVVKNYAKYKQFMDQMKDEEKKFVETMQGKQKALETLAKQLEAMPPSTDARTREAKEQDVRKLQREMEDLKLEVRKRVSQQSNDEMLKVYKEVRDAAFRHAQAHNFDLVFHFEGPADDKEVDSPVLVMRNMNAGGCVPLYWNRGLDISGYVLEALNKQFPPAARPGVR